MSVSLPPILRVLPESSHSCFSGSVLPGWGPQASPPHPRAPILLSLPASLSAVTAAQATQSPPAEPRGDPVQGRLAGGSCLLGALGHALHWGCWWLGATWPRGCGRGSEAGHPSPVVVGPLWVCPGPEATAFLLHCPPGWRWGGGGQ